MILNIADKRPLRFVPSFAYVLWGPCRSGFNAGWQGMGTLIACNQGTLQGFLKPCIYKGKKGVSELGAYLLELQEGNVNYLGSDMARP